MINKFARLILITLLIGISLSLGATNGNDYIDIKEYRNLFGKNGLEVLLTENALIYGVYINGNIVPEEEILIEYEDEGVWRPFMASTIKDSVNSFIDLSYDQIVTAKLRFTVSGERSSISSVTVLGRKAAEIYHVIPVKSVIGSPNTDFVYPAKFLLDNNTYTSWRTKTFNNNWEHRQFNEIKESLLPFLSDNRDRTSYDPTSQEDKIGEVVFEFEGLYQFETINLYFTDGAKGDFRVEADIRGKWQLVEEIRNYQARDWYHIEIKDQLITDKIRIQVTGEGGALGGIGSVNFWGKSKYMPSPKIYVGSQKDKKLSEESYFYFNLDADEVAEYYLEFAVRRRNQQDIYINLNGKGIRIEPYTFIRDYTVYKIKLKAEDLQEGLNYIRLEPGQTDLIFSNLRLSRVDNSRLGHALEDLNNNLSFTGGRALEELSVDLNPPLYQLPEFPVFPQFPSGLENRGSQVVRDWSTATIIDSDGYYELLDIHTDLIFDTANSDRIIRIKNLNIGPNVKISITGPGKVHLYLEDNLEIRNGSRINPNGDGNLVIYHSGNRLSFQGGIPYNEQYNFSGTIYTRARDIFIENGASVEGNLYADQGNLYIRGGVTANQTFYLKAGNILIENGARVNGKILSAGKNITIRGGSIYEGTGIYAPEASIVIDQGASIRGEIVADPTRVKVYNFNSQNSNFTIHDVEEKSERYIEKITVFTDSENLYLELYARVGDNWLRLLESDQGDGWLTFREKIKTDKLLIKNPARNNITQIKIYGYSTLDRKPDIQVWNPLDNQCFTNTGFRQDKLFGFVDNPETEVLINNQKAYQRGHFFWLEGNRLGTVNQRLNKLVALAKDDTGRIGSDEINIYIEEYPLLKLDQGEEIIYTDAGSIRLSGNIYSPLNKLFINEKEIAINGNRFSTEVELKEGFNLIKIEGQEINNGEIRDRRMLYARIIRHSTGISLEIESPEDGYYTNQDSISIRGVVSGTEQLHVTVNGIEAYLDGMNFISSPVHLEEGSNIINIRVTDQDNIIEKSIEVIKDTIAPVLEITSIPDSFITSSPVLLLEGNIIDHSPAFLFINQESVNISNSKFRKQLYLADGEHIISIRVVDLAGNETIVEKKVLVDTTPPLDFEIEVEPAGWTNRQEVKISFESTDEESGISHYLLSIDGGEFFTVSSPYLVYFENDGIHEIIVKALNNAGLSTEAVAKVYIDTIAPSSASDFRVTTGPDQILVRWDRYPEEENLKAFYLYRQPGWAEAEYLEIYANDVILGEKDYYEYIDTEVVPGQEYSYTLQTIDEAGNISDFTETVTIKTGIVEKAVEALEEDDDKEREPIRIEYQGVELLVPLTAVPEDGTILITAVDEDSLPESVNEIISNSVDFRFIDQNGEVKDDFCFKEEITVSFEFNYEDIPEGYTVFDLDIYYYSEADSGWIKLPRTEVDLEKGKITAKTDHFSVYNVQVNENYSPAAEDYDDQGLSPYKAYFEENQEYVSPATGSLTLNAIDFYLPGRNGLDLEIGRIYNISTLTMQLLKKAFDKDAVVKGYNGFGKAWDINLPWIEVNENGTYVYFEDGTASKISWNQKKDGNTATATATYREGKYFTAEKAQKLRGYLFDIFGYYIGGEWEDQWYTITKKDGTVYKFNGDGMITEIIDRTGNNKITFTYRGREIVRIVDSLGREINFSYSAGKISRISVGNRVYQYQYDNQDRLVKVIDPEGRETSYVYTSKEVKSGSSVSPGSSKVKTVDVPLVEKIIYPTGGESHYKYNVNGVIWYGSETKTYYVYIYDPEGDCTYEGIHCRKEKRQRTYDWTVYDMATIVVEDHYQMLAENNQKIKPVVYEYSFNYEYENNRKELSSTSELDKQDRFRVENTDILELDKKTVLDFDDDGLMLEKVIKDLQGNEIERIVYQYDSDLKEIRTKTVYKDGKDIPVYHEFFEYDNWGNITYTRHTGTGLEVNYYYYNTNSSGGNFRKPEFEQGKIDSNIRNLLAGSRVIGGNQRDGIIIQETAYQYDSKGNLLKEAVYLDGRWLVTTYKYDQYGNVIEMVDPRGVTTELRYSAEYNYGFLTEKISKGMNGRISNADGEILAPLIYSYGYDFNTGLKTWEIDPEGNLTEYEYDRLGRLVKIIYPVDEEKEIIKNIPRADLRPVDYGDRKNNPVKIQYYDDQEISTTVINVTENIDLNDYRVRNRQIVEPVFNKSKYYYDSLNRWVKLEQYLKEGELSQGQTSPFVTRFVYDQLGNRVETIDARGNRTRTEYDLLGRVTKIIYPDNSFTEIKYDNYDNSRLVIDQEGNQTYEKKDWAGNVIEVSKYNQGVKYSSYAVYDRNGNLIYEIDANGRRTDYYYDQAGRLIEKHLPAGEYILPGNSVPTPDYRPVVKYEYDDSGNLIEEILPSANTGLVNPADYTYYYHYDELNRKIKTIDPEGNEIKVFYDQLDREIKEVDPLGNSVEIIYDSRGNQRAIIDGEGNISYKEYDIIGQEIASYDPRGVIPAVGTGTGKLVVIKGKNYRLDPAYCTTYQYDSLGRKIKTTDPAGNTVYYNYDEVGNIIKVVDGEQTTSYGYNQLYFLIEEVLNPGDPGEMRTRYEYDRVGNLVKKTEPRNQVISYEYDDLYRLTRVIKPDGSSERYQYDRVGNRTMLVDGNGNITRYFYNGQNELNRVIEAGGEETRYYYDLEGNLVRKEMANGLITKYSYNNLGQLIKEEKPGNKPVYFSYDRAGNLKEKKTPLAMEVYHYNKNKQIIAVEYYAQDNAGNYPDKANETMSFAYDQAGNRILAEKRTGDKLISRIVRAYDPLNRIISETRTIEGKAYKTEYRYDRHGNLTGLKYPGSNSWLEYSYDRFNLLEGIENIGVDIVSPQFSYYKNGSLESISYPNGIETRYTLDNNSRIEEIKVDNKNTRTELLKLNYQYDSSSNIIRRNNNRYEYDHLNRLKKAEIEGNFYRERGSNYGYIMEDYLGDLGLDTNMLGTELITLDYNSGSVGIDLGRVEDNISRIELRTIGINRHRLTEETIDIYLSADNISYQLLERNQWQYSRDPLGNITIELKDVSARYIKVHSKFTDRNADFEIVNIGEFKNILRELIRVYQRNEKAVINYEYDKVGNRTREIFNSGRMEITDYIYYPGSNRLMTDGSYGYLYDEAGNLIEKGNRYNIEGDSVILIETEGSGVEYWEYEYNLQNRLSRVRKNGEVIAEFLYDADGMRIKSTEKILEEETNRTSYYVYSYSGSVLMEESTDNGSSNSPEAKYNSYIYAFGKIFAKVDGILDSTYITAEDIFYFHHDNLGSTRLISDGAGNVVMDQDYMPFGGDLPVVGQTEVLDEEAGGYKYTGQKEVISIGLYYYGARYYDPSIGRFITEDTYPGEMINPQSQNLYVYVMNNPLRYIDPTGNVTEEIIEGISVETGMYFENKYLLFIVDLNLHILQIRYKETKTESGEIIYQYPITEFHQDAVNADLTINAGFFGESWNPTSATVGDIIMDGNYKSFYKVNYKEGKDAPYFIVWNDNNGKQDFVFAPMEIQKEGWYKGSYLIPEEYRDSNYGLGNVGPLINQGNIVDSSKSYHTQWNVKPTSRTIFGVNQQQDKAYFFIGVGEWTLNKAAELLIEKGVYYGVFLDGGGSTQVITNNPKYNYYTGRPITSVIQTKSRNK